MAQLALYFRYSTIAFQLTRTLVLRILMKDRHRQIQGRVNRPLVHCRIRYTREVPDDLAVGWGECEVLKQD